MKRIGKLLFLSLPVLFGCRSEKSKAELKDVRALCDNKLYVETYGIFSGGAYGGDKVSEYITDSSNFRKYIGTFDNAVNFYSYICKDDSLYIYFSESHSPNNKILSIKNQLISQLKKERKFE